MNGIDPPMPVSTASAPHASVMARFASAAAQPSVSTRNGSPRVDVVDRDVRAERRVGPQVPLERRVRLAGGLPGRHARADAHGDARKQGVRGVRHARRVDAGDRDRRLRPEPGQDRARCRSASRRRAARRLAELLLASSRAARPRPPVRRGRRRRPSRSRRAGSRAGATSASIASGAAPPYMPECEACSSVETVSRKVTLPRRETVRRRGVDVDVVGVGDDDHVGGQRIRVLLRGSWRRSGSRTPPRPR